MKKFMKGFFDALGTFSPIIILTMASCSYLITPAREKFIPLMPVNEKKMEIEKPAEIKNEPDPSRHIRENFPTPGGIKHILIKNHSAIIISVE